MEYRLPILIFIVLLSLVWASTHNIQKRNAQRRRPALHEILRRRKIAAEKSKTEEELPVEEPPQDPKLATLSNKGDEDIIKTYSSPSSYPFAPSYADPNLLAAVMNQADEANFRYPNHNPISENRSQKEQISKLENTKQEEGNIENEVEPDEIYSVPDGSVHSNLKDELNVVNEKTDPQPIITGGYANIKTNVKPIKDRNENLRIRPARRRIPSRKRLSANIDTSKSDSSVDDSKRPKFPKRLPPVRSGSANPLRRRIRPVRFRQRLPQKEPETSVQEESSGDGDEQKLYPQKIVVSKPLENTESIETPEISKPEHIHDQNPNVKAEKIRKVNIPVNTSNPKIRRPLFPNFRTKLRRNRIRPERNTQYNNNVKDTTNELANVKSIPTKPQFKPSMPDPFIIKQESPESRAPPSLQYENFPQQTTYYDPEVLPPIVNSFERPVSVPNGKFDRVNQGSVNQYQVNPSHNTQIPESPTFIDYYQSDATHSRVNRPSFHTSLRPPPVKYDSSPHVQYHPRSQYSPNEELQKPPLLPTRRRQASRRNSPKKKPSFLESLGFFSRRKGNYLPSSKRANKIRSNPKDIPVNYVLSHGVPPLSGKKVRLVGPFKTPPYGAPFIHHTTSGNGHPMPPLPSVHIQPPLFSPKKHSYQSQQKNASKKSTGFKVIKVPVESQLKKSTLGHNQPDQKQQINYVRPPQPLIQTRSSNNYGKSDTIYGRPAVSNVQPFKKNSRVTEVRASYGVSNVPPKDYLGEVTEEDKERLIAAKFFFPNVPSIRRSASDRHVIPLPVPLINTNGQHVMSVQPISLPHLPIKTKHINSDLTSRSERGKLFRPTPRKLRSSQSKNISKTYDPPVSYVDPVSSPVHYEGWQAIDSNRPRPPVIGMLKQHHPSFPMRNTMYTPKINKVDPRILTRQPRKMEIFNSDDTSNTAQLQVGDHLI